MMAGIIIGARVNAPGTLCMFFVDLNHDGKGSPILVSYTHAFLLFCVMSATNAGVS